jgi:lipoprotein-anchoring transpeptidase ErfK/SrfK
MGRPSRRTSTRTRWRVLGAVAGVLVLAVTAACGSGVDAQWRNADGTTPSSAARLAAKLSYTVENNAADVAPIAPIQVSVLDGRLDSVNLANADGKPVQGAFDADQKTWKNSEELGYDKAYTLTVVSTGEDGKPVQETRSFTTLKPNNFTLPYLRANVGLLLDGGTFGVGQPAVVWFDEKITDKVTAEKALTITTDPATIGGWRWINDHEVHWRPAEYWKPGTKVTVTAKVYGVNLGDGLYGQEDRTASFTIGPSKIAVADSSTKRMTVYVNGSQVTTINGNDVSGGIPVSLGRNGGETAPNGSYIDFRTNSGPHVVTGKAEVVRMTSASYGLTDPTSPNFYDSQVRKAVQISGDGEYVHLADWNIPQHGVSNTSHGCINVAPAYIFWFYDTFGPGDIVDVKNTGKQLGLGNGIADWVLSWDEWQKGSALAG